MSKPNMTDEAMERTLHVSNLDERVTDEILYELMLQAGPVENVALITKEKEPYAFVVFEESDSVPYAISLFRRVKLFNRPLVLKPRTNTNQYQLFRQVNFDPERMYRPSGLLHLLSRSPVPAPPRMISSSQIRNQIPVIGGFGRQRLPNQAIIQQGVRFQGSSHQHLLPTPVVGAQWNLQAHRLPPPTTASSLQAGHHGGPIDLFTPLLPMSNISNTPFGDVGHARATPIGNPWRPQGPSGDWPEVHPAPTAGMSNQAVQQTAANRGSSEFKATGQKKAGWRRMKPY